MGKVLFLLCLLLFTNGVQAAEAPFSLGVHPYLDAKEIKRRFDPLADYLSRHLDREVRVHVGINYDDHIRAIGDDRLDMAFLGPASYVEMARQYGEKPILARIEANGEPSFYGYIVVLHDSPVAGLSDLRDKRFAFGDPDSTMGTLVPCDMLLQAGVALDELDSYRHLTGHENVALAVLAGAADAGAVKAEIYEHFRPQGLRALARTPSISEHLFVARSGLDPELVVALRKLLLGLRDAREVGRVLEPIKKGATALVPAEDSDYDNLREIARCSADVHAERDER